MKILNLKTYRQPSGCEITLQKVRMVWTASTDLCVERLGDGEFQAGWYGWGEDTLRSMLDDWIQFEERIGSTLI